MCWKEEERKTMMNRFDLGGCCLARYGAATPYFASKTDQIMSRYRPIAPKPVAQNTGGVVDAVQQRAQQPPPPPPPESSGIRSCNRSRKRSWDAAAPSSRGQKRAARSRGNVLEVGGEGQQRHIERSSSVVLGDNTSLRPHSDTSDNGVSTLWEISDSAGSKDFGLAPHLSLSSSCTSFDSTLVAQTNEGLLDKDAAFMERAAASASPNVNLPERILTSKQALISSEIVHARRSVSSDMQEATPLTLFDVDMEQEKQDIVTLPLLPNDSYCKESPSTSNSPGNGNGNGMQVFFNDHTYSLPDLTLSDSYSNIITHTSPLLDISLLDHLYSNSPDPVILTDDSYSHRLLWYNPAYKRLASASVSELGIPKLVATFTQKKHPPSACTATMLWGFTCKKMGSPAGVIMPQPVRPVGSNVVVECIIDTNLQASVMCGSMEEVEEELESQNSPCLISDFHNRVRWANSAYKQMVGQPECSWLNSRNKDKSDKVTRLHGEVLLVFNLSRFALAKNVTAFSCRVKIQWTNGAEKSSMTVPCDVVRINGKTNDHFSYAWQFDIQAALCL